MPAVTTDQLQALQDDISAGVQVILQAYDQCKDAQQSLDLMNQAQQLSAQMAEIEQALFHQQTLEAAEAATALTAANGFTSQLTAMAKSLEQVSNIVAAGAKLIGAVTQVVAYLG